MGENTHAMWYWNVQYLHSVLLGVMHRGLEMAIKEIGLVRSTTQNLPQSSSVCFGVNGKLASVSR